MDASSAMLQKVIQKLTHHGICSTKQAVKLWNGWQKNGSGNIEEFLLSQGIEQNLIKTLLHKNSTQKNQQPLKKIGNYNIIEEIARGGMGIVYKAQAMNSKTIVAIKVLISDGEEEIQRFIREAKTMLQIQHTNIISILEVGTHNDRHYYVMPYIEGKTLDDFKKKGQLRKNIQILQKIAIALHQCHKRGILHRDLKPSNILIDKHQKPFLTDFGLAKITGTNSCLTKSNIAMGTPLYMSPEQMENSKTVAAQSDIYSLGVILYEILTGELPFIADNIIELRIKIQKGNFILPSKLNSKISKILEAICTKCLSQNPDKRYSTAQEFAKELDRFLKGRKSKAKKQSFVTSQMHIKLKKHSFIIALVLLNFVTIAYFSFKDTSPSHQKQKYQRFFSTKPVVHEKTSIITQENLPVHANISSKQQIQQILNKRANFLQGKVYSKQGKYYLHVYNKVSQEKAQQICKYLGGHLVTINTVAEENFLLSFIQPNISYWIGIDPYEKHWYNNEKVSYSNWPIYQDNLSTKAGIALGMNKQDNHTYWSQYNKKKQLPFICEWGKQQNFLPKNTKRQKIYSFTKKTYNLAKSTQVTYSDHLKGSITLRYRDASKLIVSFDINKNPKKYHFFYTSVSMPGLINGKGETFIHIKVNDKFLQKNYRLTNTKIQTQVFSLDQFIYNGKNTIEIHLGNSQCIYYLKEFYVYAIKR